MSDYYQITESSELDCENKGPKHILIWPCTSAKFWNFCVGIHNMKKASTFGVMKSYLTRVWDKKIRNAYMTLETRIVMR